MSAAEIGRISIDLQDTQRAAVHALTLPPGNRSAALTRRTDKPQGDDEEKTMRKLTVLMVLAVVLAACAGGGDGAIGGLMSVGAGPTGAPVVDQQLEEIDLAPEPGSLDVVFDVPDDRKVIRRASLQIEAADTRKVFDEILEMTEIAGGFVSNATVFPVEGEDEQPQVTMTLRVPADQLSATLTAIKGAADEVISETQGAQDVTEEYVDLNAQLTNLEALEVELRALLEEVRKQPTADPDKLLRVFSEIALVRGQIEQIQGQLNYLEDVVALATVEVQLTPTVIPPPIVDDEWKPVEVAREALTQLMVSLQRFAEWGINFVILTLPMLLIVMGIPIAVGIFVYRKWRRKDRSGPPLPTES